MNPKLRIARRSIRALALLKLGTVLAAPGLAADTMRVVDVLGSTAAERPVTYEGMSRYLEHITRASDRVRSSVYGTTTLRRDLRVLTISSPENLARLDAIRTDWRRLAANTDTEAAAHTLMEGLPASVWIGYGTHADELSGSDAGLRLIEALVSGTDARTLELLEQLVIHVDPIVNPDGRERFLNHVATFERRVPVLDAQDILRYEFWPPTRFNHYLVDLNRDALFLTQPQSAARVSAIHAAYPQLFVDAHEMSYHSTFLFALPADPLNPYLPSAIHRSWQRVGADLARAFDEAGQSYYTRSWNEVFYPGYYDILPAYSGITPLLYEQARTHGVSVLLPNGRTRTYSEAVANLLRSSLATLGSAADHRQALLNDWWAARRSAAREIGAVGPKAWIVPTGNSFKLAKLARILEHHQIEYQRLATPVRVSRLYSAYSEQPQPQLLPVGTILVRTAQPVAGLIRNLFDYHVPMDAAFLRAERERADLRRKTQIYDITAWSLPLAFDLAAYWSDSVPAGDWRSAAEGGWPTATAIVPARYGYLYEDPSLYMTARLLSRGVRIRVASEAFERSGRAFPIGTFLIRHDDQAQAIDTVLDEEAARAETSFLSIDSARIVVGPDLGDDKFVLLSTPHLAVLVGSATQATSVGALWQMFDEGIGIPVSLLDISRLSEFDLSRYNVLILPDANRPVLAAALGGGVSEHLKRWILSGGTLIAEGGSLLAAAQVGLSGVAPRGSTVERYAPLMLGPSAAERTRAGQLTAKGAVAEPLESTRAEAQQTLPVMSAAVQVLLDGKHAGYVFPPRLPTFAQWAEGVPEPEQLRRALPEILAPYLPRGAYLQAALRPQHWLRYGTDDRIPVLFRETDAVVAEGAVEAIGRFKGARELVLGGLVWPEAVGYIAETAYLTRERQGQGQLIGFASDAAYRGYSLGTQRLLLNAAILGPGMRTQ